ncbi:MAG: PorT family protein [Chitinophagaceae bacterium]|jgi:hypothetical protein|nr:PorT family protein [Chitinophagaceae bacterium]OQY93248.1 MAG: hypothetical protein B6D37_12360 [Sphingobacteriales bacterium UTBCD1]
MKKIFFSLLLSTVFVIAAQAQFGVNAGLNISNLHGNDLSDAKSKIGPHFGVFYNIPVSNGISVQTEASYSGEGAKANSGDGKFLIDYLNLAALFRYNFEGGFNLATGPQYGFLLSAKSKYGGQTYDMKDNIKGGNFCWAFGAGYDLPMGFGFYGRYNLGLSNIEKNGEGGSVKTNCFQFGVRYTINTGGEKK